MRQDLAAAPRAVEPRLSRLAREIGLAAVAAELDLAIETLAPEMAEAVERGAAALFPAGYGPSLTRIAASGRTVEKDSRRKARAGSSARRAAPVRIRKDAPAIATTP
jgi:hypothetical protein